MFLMMSDRAKFSLQTPSRTTRLSHPLATIRFCSTSTMLSTHVGLRARTSPPTPMPLLLDFQWPSKTVSLPFSTSPQLSFSQSGQHTSTHLTTRCTLPCLSSSSDSSLQPSRSRSDQTLRRPRRQQSRSSTSLPVHPGSMSSLKRQRLPSPSLPRASTVKSSSRMFGSGTPLVSNSGSLRASTSRSMPTTPSLLLESQVKASPPSSASSCASTTQSSELFSLMEST